MKYHKTVPGLLAVFGLAAIWIMVTGSAVAQLVAADAGRSTPNTDGFIQRWMILEPIRQNGLTQSAVRTAIETQHFPGQLTTIPEDGDTVTVGDETLTWHVAGTDDYNLNLYYFSQAYDKPTSNVLFWVVAVIDSPREVADVRLAIGSNAASVWWVNGEEVIGIYNDRQAVIDDGVSKRITLKRGRNVIRAAIINGGGATDFCARFLDQNDEPLTGYSIIHPAPAPNETRPATAASRTAGAAPRRGVVSDGGGGRGFGSASPIFAADRMVTFRVSAPEAHTISLTSDFLEETPLVKGEDGVWSVTVGPVEPDIYYYNLVVDGVRGIDPGNSHVKIGYYTSTLVSVLTVPGDAPAFYDVKDVPHGEIRTHLYKSKSNDVVRELNVYVPPGYDENPDKRYPVLYLLHGNANDHHSWHRYGRANEILDNMIAEGEIEPFLVVMPLGYGRASVDGDGTGVAANSGPDNRPIAAGQGGGFGGPDMYERDILEDVIPMIDNKYRTIADRRSRAIFGFSMGGGQSGRIGLGNLDVFSQVGVMSAGFRGGADAEPLATLAKDVTGTNKKIDLLWIGCGREDFLFQSASEFSQSLTELGIDHTFVETDGAHHWRVWRRYLRDVATLLFRY